MTPGVTWPPTTTDARIQDRSGALDQPLLERGSELAELDRLCARACEGSGGVALVEGPAGIGKSRLLGAIESRARDRGMTVLSARCGEFEHDLGWAAVRDLFAPALQAAGEARRRELLGGAARLAELALAGPETDAGEAHDRMAAALHGLYWLTAGLAARGPLLVVVDDLHWADPPSLRFVAYLAARLDDLPLALLVAARPGAAAPHGELLAAIAARATVVRPAPFSRPATGQVLARALGDGVGAAFGDAVHTSTGGNPFLLREVAAQLAREGVAPVDENAEAARRLTPETVAQSVLLRLATLPPGAADLSAAVALLGGHATLADAAALCELEPDVAEAAASALVEADILAPRLPLDFAHPIVRAVVHDEIPAARRTRWHARAARLLARGGAPIDEVAAHLAATEPAADATVAATLREAAAQALARGAPETAAAHLRRALAEPPPARERAVVLLELGIAEAQTGEPTAVDRLREAAGRTDDPVVRARAALPLARLMSLRGRAQPAVEVLDAAVTELGEREPELRLRLEVEAIDSARQDFATSGAFAARIDALAERTPPGTHAERLLLANMALRSAMAGDSAETTIELAERALAGGSLIERESADSPACYLAVQALYVADRPELALAHLAVAFDDARRRASAPGFAMASLYRAHVHVARGAMADAEADARAALGWASDCGWEPMLPCPMASLVDALTARGAYDEADAELERLGFAGPAAEPVLRAARMRARPDVAGARRRRRRRAGAAADRPADGRDRRAQPRSLRLALGRGRGAGRARPGRRGARAGRRGPGARARVRSAARGRDRAAGGGDAGAGRAPARARLRRSRRAGLVGVRARAGARTRGARRDATPPQPARGRPRSPPPRTRPRRALRRDRAGRARARRAAPGRRPPGRTALTGRAALTPSELRVAEMAAAGAANREIAQALFVSLRTVETHLTQAYRKLGIASRAELARALDA